MTTVKGRTMAILEAAVEYFIRMGAPITSARLFEAYDFGIKPAMIRCELNKLGKQGFFEQGHPSGGRRPTHKAYRFFVNGLLARKGDEDEKANETPKAFADLRRAILEGEREAFVELLSDLLEVLGVGYAPREEYTYQSGLSELLFQIEDDGRSEMLAVVRDFEAIADRLQRNRWWEEEFTGPRVFIGQSPITKSPNLSVIADRFHSHRGDFLVFAIGPNRMDYERSIHLFRSIREFSVYHGRSK